MEILLFLKSQNCAKILTYTHTKLSMLGRNKEDFNNEFFLFVCLFFLFVCLFLLSAKLTKCYYIQKPIMILTILTTLTTFLKLIMTTTLLSLIQYWHYTCTHFTWESKS